MTLTEQWAALYAAGKVRWMPGMLCDAGRIACVETANNGAQMPMVYHDERISTVGPRTIDPDFTDPATIGCLVAQINERVTWHWTAPHEDPAGQWGVFRFGVAPETMAYAGALLAVLGQEGAP
jgi:hypothetical protein